MNFIKEEQRLYSLLLREKFFSNVLSSCKKRKGRCSYTIEKKYFTVFASHYFYVLKVEPRIYKNVSFYIFDYTVLHAITILALIVSH